MITPVISVIIPIYNAENTICRMVDSLLAQTFTDFELLLIDDGSTDGTAAILEEYKRQDGRVRVYYKTNGGVASARQKGLENAQGEYLIHADADDWVESTMLEEMLAKARACAADVVIADYFYNEGTKQQYIKQCPPSLEAKDIQKALLKTLHGSCCNKLVKYDCLLLHNIKFPTDIDYCEDLLTWIELYSYPIHTVYLPKAFYHYVFSKTSITNNYNRQKYEMRMKFANRMKALLPYHENKEIIENLYNGIITEGYFMGAISGGECRSFFSANIKKELIHNNSLRRKLGYVFLLIGLDGIAKKFLDYRRRSLFHA